MALIIEEESQCCLCGEILNGQKEFLLIPPLISNTKDSLFKFSDAGVHEECLSKSGLNSKLIKHVSIYDQRSPPSELKCIVDGKTICEPEKWISIGLLTSDEGEELYQFNYINLNKDNLDKWIQKENFIKTVNEFLEEDKWASLTEFNYLTYIINEVIKVE